jgi:geranylgeranyl diphosphate synthase type II
MPHKVNLDADLGTALASATQCPPRLAQAMADAVFPGGARLRPRLCLAVAADRRPASKAARVAATAIELLHCASLVHDDLPCFDDASVRRGRPTIHTQHGDALATLAGDGLIMAAFAHLSCLQGACGQAILAEIAVAARRMVWGQALESEPVVDVTTYHGHKTAALFEAATVCGAIAAAGGRGRLEAAELNAWRAFGRHIGGLYQIADDILDVTAKSTAIAGKSPGRDSPLGRPNHAVASGLPAAQRRLAVSLQGAREALTDLQQGRNLWRWFESLEARLRAQPGLLAPTPAPSAAVHAACTGIARARPMNVPY